MQQTDVVIAGAGVIGMALALELRSRGRRVTLVERLQAACGASSAAAGMLAANDSCNPRDLQPLATFSRQTYPVLLERLREWAPSHAVQIQTEWTLEQAADAEDGPMPTGVLPGAYHWMQEQSLDPRQLTAALYAACKKQSVAVIEGTTLRGVPEASGSGLRVAAGDDPLQCTQFVDCTGAWSSAGVRPVKGQMLRVHLGSTTPYLPGRGNVVVRTPSIYVVPRLDGSALVGATLEESGFCVKTEDSAMDDLRARAAALVPGVAAAPELERWAGLRPATADGLPLLGRAPDDTTGACFVATGHFRNGILLAPGTAVVMAQLLCGEPTAVPLGGFCPARFASVSCEHRAGAVTVAQTPRYNANVGTAAQE